MRLTVHNIIHESTGEKRRVGTLDFASGSHVFMNELQLLEFEAWMVDMGVQMETKILDGKLNGEEGGTSCDC